MSENTPSHFLKARRKQKLRTHQKKIEDVFAPPTHPKIVQYNKTDKTAMTNYLRFATIKKHITQVTHCILNLYEDRTLHIPSTRVKQWVQTLESVLDKPEMAEISYNA